jgi:copper chaperone CopZ
MLRALRYGFLTLPRDINKALLIGIVVAGVISAAIPNDYLSSVLGGGIVSMLIMMAVGIPVYVCATASVPIAAALVAKGVSPGAALVFLMTGPATNAATITTVWRIMGRRIAGIYIFAVAASALVSGLVLDLIFKRTGAHAMVHAHRMLPGYVKTICALALLGILFYAFRRPKKLGEAAHGASADRMLRLSIKGMTCNHCADAVRRALLESPGVDSAEVDLKRGEAVVTGADMDVSQLSKAIESLGYRVTGHGEHDPSR